MTYCCEHYVFLPLCRPHVQAPFTIVPALLLSYLILLAILLWPKPGWQRKPLARYCVFYLFLIIIAWLGLASKTGLIINGLLPITLYLRTRVNSPLRLPGEVACILIPLLSAVWPALGFNSLTVWGPLPLYEQGSAFLLSLSLPKMILVLAFGCSLSLTNKLRPHWPGLIVSWLMAAGLVILAYSMGVPLIIKWGAYLPWFLLLNLLVTVLAEELFFRLLLQETLTRWLKGHWARWLAALGTGLLFYAVHGFALPDSVIAWIYLITSLVYALFYTYYRNLLASISLHFTVNVLHILFLAYPLI